MQASVLVDVMVTMTPVAAEFLFLFYFPLRPLLLFLCVLCVNASNAVLRTAG